MRPPIAEWSAGLEAVLHSLGDGVSIADTTGKIVFSNDAADRMLGIGAAEGPPETWADHYGVFEPDETTPFPADRYPLVRALHGEETQGVEMFVRNPAVPGGVLISVTGRPLRGIDGRSTGAAVVFRDITTLRRAQKDLEQAHAKLVEAQRLRDEVTTFLVHDLKGPITGIMAAAGLIEMGGGSAQDDLDQVAAIQESAATLHRMVLDMLDVQLSEDGALAPDRETIRIGVLFDRVAATAATRVGGSGQRLIVTAPPEELIVDADPELLRRVLLNLIENGVKYGPRDGAIEVDAQRMAGSVRFRVRDQGPGVPPDMRERIFEKYARYERTPDTPRHDSRGVGLRFCRVVAEAHGGRVWVEDNRPRGACFLVEIPG